MDEKKNQGKLRMDLTGVIAILGILLGCFWIMEGSSFPSSTKDGTPGAGVFPIGISALFIIVCLVMLVQSFKKINDYQLFAHLSGQVKRKLVLTFLFCVAFVFIWKHTHYILASALLTFGLALLYKVKPWIGAAYAVCFSVITYILFTKLLQVMLVI